MEYEKKLTGYEKKLTKEKIEEILLTGVKGMPQNPASQGYKADQIREFYYAPEKKILYILSELENGLIDLEAVQLTEEELVNLGFVKNTDYASTSNVGLVSIGSGLQVNGNGHISILPAYNEEHIKSRGSDRVFTFNNLDKALKIGLSTNTEVLTEEEKTDISAWLGTIKAPTKPSSFNYLLTFNQNGVAGTLRYSTGAKDSDVIPQKESGGRLRVGDPTTEDHATTKRYVDNLPDYLTEEQKAKWQNWVVLDSIKNQIKGLYSGLIQKEIFAVAEDVKINEETQTTGGSELSEFNIVDNSYATVQKIIGNAVWNENAKRFEKSKIEGIKSVNSDLSLESVMTLPQTVELDKWDYIENQKIYRKSYTLAFDTEEKINLFYVKTGFGNNEIIFNTIVRLQEMGFIKSNSDGHSNDVILLSSEFTAISGVELYRGIEGICISDNFVRIVDNRFSTIDEFKAYLRDLNNQGKPLTIVYETEQVVEENDFAFDNQYLVWDKGQETILSPNDSDGLNSFDYGANPTIENDYYVLVGAEG
jgi:hypothetical protein